jgi:hypothetical protein
VSLVPEDRDERPAEETYHKVDKRARVDESPVEREVPPPDEDGGAAAADAEGGAEPQDTGPMLDTYALMRLCLNMFLEQAWVQLGIQLSPGQKELTLDLAQARAAIDAVAYLKQALNGQLTPAEDRDVEQMLSTLRLNFVQRS